MFRELRDGLSWAFVAGFGINFAWTSSVFFHSLLFTSAGHSFTFSNFYLASMAVLIVSLALMGVCFPVARKSFQKPPALVCAGIMLLVGTYGAANASFDGLPGIACFWAGVLFTGFGSAFMLGLWGWFLGTKVKTPAANMCAAYLLATPLYFLLSLLPASITVAVVGLLPALSLWVYFSFGRNTDDLPSMAKRTDAEAAEALFPARCAAADGEGANSPAPEASPIPRISIAAVLAGVVLSLMNYTPSGDGPSNFTFALYFLLASAVPLVCFLLYFQAYKGKSSAADRLVMAYRIAVLVMVGSVLLSIAIMDRNLAFQEIALAGYICLKMVFWSLFAALSRTAKLSPITIFCFGEGCLTAGLFIGNQISSVLGLQFASATAALTLAILLATYMFALPERKMYAMMQEQEDDDEPRHQRFRARCEEIAAAYKLSRRETEVFTLFARGRSSSRIADDLYVSSGTVSTHLRNIYRKLDVHSRQELLDLIEGSGE